MYINIMYNFFIPLTVNIGVNETYIKRYNLNIFPFPDTVVINILNSMYTNDNKFYE